METAGLLASAQTAFHAGRYEEARDLFLLVLHDRPGDAATLRSLSTVSTRLGDAARAFRYSHEAVRLHPQDAEAHFTLALLYLLHGNYEKGFIEYEWRLFRPNCIIPRHAQGVFWDGRPLPSQPLLLHAEQGFGDNLQFIRFLPWLRERVANIHLACHPELVRLFSGLEGLASVVTDGQPLPSCEYHCPLLSLPRLAHATLATLPREAPYLAAKSPPRPDARRPRVGLAWRANRSSPNSASRSVPLADLAALADHDCDWISLQRDPDAAERALLRDTFHAEEPAAAFRDFQDTAEFLQTLDLVITPDTAVVHLAGALALPTWVLLPRWADWRWLLDRPDSPWYPSAVLFRQTHEGDWSGPVREVRESLARLGAEGPSRR